MESAMEKIVVAPRPGSAGKSAAGGDQDRLRLLGQGHLVPP